MNIGKEIMQENFSRIQMKQQNDSLEEEYQNVNSSLTSLTVLISLCNIA